MRVHLWPRVCVFVCASSTLGLWECSVLLSHGICPMSPRGDVRTEVRANAPPRGRRFTSCLSGPNWAESSVERWTVFMISKCFNLSVSVSFRLCGWCYNRRSQRISSYRRGRCTVWGTLWSWPSNMWGRPLCECTQIHKPVSINVLAISHVCVMLEWAPKVTFL